MKRLLIASTALVFALASSAGLAEHTVKLHYGGEHGSKFFKSLQTKDWKLVKISKDGDTATYHCSKDCDYKSFKSAYKDKEVYFYKPHK